MSKAQGEKPDGGEDKLMGSGEKLERTDKFEKAELSGMPDEPKRPASGGGDLTIYLFGRTGREKEEWFRRFLLASRLKSEGRGGSLPGICKTSESEPCTLSHTKVQAHNLHAIICLNLSTHILCLRRNTLLPIE